MNLVPGQKPSDIYTEVLEVVRRKVSDEAAVGNEHAIFWETQGLLKRSIVKRPVMTMPYGATQRGMQEQILGELTSGSTSLCDNETVAHANWLGTLVYGSIGEVVVAAKDAMAFLRQVAQVAGKNKLPVHWTTPVGFWVMQAYRTKLHSRVESLLLGNRIQVQYSTETDQIDPRKSTAGIAPNYVHSMDASHMMLTVQACADVGLYDLSMVHDSYGSHASDIPTLSRVLREQFIHIYSVDRLSRFREEIASQLPDELAVKLPEVPAVGTLDISLVMDSAYFFS